MNRLGNRLLHSLMASVALTVAVGTSAQTPATSPATTAATTSTSARTVTGDGAGTSNGAALSARDKKFMNEAAKGGLAEVQLGKLAAERANDPQVKQFAEMMIADHSRANDRLQQIASQKGIVLPTDLAPDAKRTANRLSKLDGAEFDREYVKAMVADHRKDVGEFRSASKQARDPQVNAFAKDTLRVIEAHSQMVANLSSTAKRHL